MSLCKYQVIETFLFVDIDYCILQILKPNLFMPVFVYLFDIRVVVSGVIVVVSGSNKTGNIE